MLRALLKSIRIKLLSNFCTGRLQFKKKKSFLALDQIQKLIIVEFDTKKCTIPILSINCLGRQILY